jgi:hypothetical protein
MISNSGYFRYFVFRSFPGGERCLAGFYFECDAHSFVDCMLNSEPCLPYFGYYILDSLISEVIESQSSVFNEVKK